MIRAIDVSRHQGDGINTSLPDYDKIPDDIKLIIARASVGPYYIDPTYRYHLCSHGSGRDFGTYTVYHPNYSLADHQENIKTALGDNPPRLIVADMEKGKSWTMPSKAVVTDGSFEFMDWLENHYTDSVIAIYSARWYWDSWILKHVPFLKWPLFVAQYPYQSRKKQYRNHASFERDNREIARLPGLWERYIGWQFSEKGRMAGISSKSVDLDIIDDDFYEAVFGASPISVPDEWRITLSSEREIHLVR